MPSATLDLVRRAAEETASAASASASSASTTSQPSSYKVIGIVLAVTSGFLIGSSFIFKKRGLISATKKAGNAAGEGHPYLKSPMWWTGMIIMILGEVCNLVAYSFADAILVTPMGSVSVVVSGVLSHFILKERLTTFGWIGSALCILGSVIIALNGPSTHDSADIESFMHLFIGPGFLAWLGVCIAAALGMIFFVAPKYGKTHMLVYIGICSLLGGLSVACTSGLGSSILQAIRGDSSQWKHWFLYFLLVFCVVTLLAEIQYLNKALELFNTAMVTPIYYVVFTGCTLVTSIILHKGFSGSSVKEIITLVFGFLVICFGISILQLSKVDAEEIKEDVLLDRKSTMLLAASRVAARGPDGHNEKGYEMEDPGVDTIRGVGGAIGSIHRAISMRRSMSRMGSMESGFKGDDAQMRRRGRNGAPGAMGSGPSELEMGMRGAGVTRYQLYDEPVPMPADAADKISLHSSLASPTLEGRQRSSTITFSNTDAVHRYGRDGVQHTQQPRLDGTHTHRDLSPSGLPSSAPAVPTSPLSKEAYSSDRSSSLFVNSSYMDPYAEEAHHSEGDPSFPSSPRAQTLPRRQGSSPKPSLAEQLGGSFASSSPDLIARDFSPSAEDLERGSSAPGGTSASAPPTRHRFMIPSFRRDSGSTDGHGAGAHRVPHPKGPRDLEEQESEALVSGAQQERRDSTSDEEGGAELGGRLECYDSRDQL
ncbi:hypothetical protein JCM10207_004355 [Rhodosporidiobolus poonsookiae]